MIVMYKIILLVAGVLGLACVGSAQIVQLGQCETISLMENFDLNSFATGTWYEIGKTSTENADCSNLQFTSNTDGTISVSNPSVANNFLQTATGTASHTSGTAQLSLTLSSSTTPIAFWILGSDYSNYAIAINCVDVSTTLREIDVWQLGRAVNSYDTAATLTAANNVLSTIGMSVSNLQAIDHSTSACTQLPVIPTGEPVILSGQCTTATVPVVQNFDVVAFTGIWHEISSYYSVNAVGTCARASYTLVGSTVNVVNSQVLNQQLDTIDGTATLIGTDQSGRLSVVLNVSGILVTQELFVIGTDYTSYAVSYSCVNLPNDQRQVNAWVLSRSRQISTVSQTGVNQVFASFVDLNEAYLLPTDQSDTGCFYYPAYEVGVPVVFPGQCDETVAAVSAFNLAQFTGTWHEIEAYPKEQQSGTCVNHDFTANTGNALNLVSNQIVNQLATTASGSVTLNSTDGSGRLWLSITTGGQVIEFPYWVLSTDYNNYALVYSCMNLDTDFRAVNAWKLSRTNAGLTAAASTAIDAAIANVQVLDNEYFETQNQTDAGCFFYPELQPGTPVIFPGQCDSTIPVQANFDPVAYMGLWHDIQSYPSTFQTGTCNNAFYTLVDGTVDVYNTQVINQQLDTMTGVGIIPDASEPAKLLVSFPVAGTNLTTSTEYWVLGTDYANYSLVYSCSNLANDLQAVFSWKLSRTKALTAAATAAIDAITANIPVLDSRYYVPQDQSEAGCFYFPEARPGVPVVFPGQCSDTISAIPNFNFAQFAGTWHEIEAYPKEQQTGTCVNHDFTATAENSLNLVSNQIVNQLPTTASGSVTLNTTDGSGRLWLSITTGGQVIEIPYWVLSTDYNNYALVYSCMDLDTDFRAVNAWKLSRTNAGLTDAASTAINAAMANVQVLDNQYFETQNQTDAGCFFYPELQPGTPVIFPGQCDSTIPVQANFDPVAYMGLWHDIQSYPSTFQTGTCNNAFYTLVDGTVDVFNTQVINQQLDTMTGVGIIPDASEPAKLLVSFPVAGTNLTTSTEYWVLGTDYANYSLVYSCSNLANDLQAVFSWKLSRTKALTAAATAAIDAITANIPVLDSRYYVPQDQSEAGCFYFPEARPGVPVVFPGQCSDTISAIPNFNFAQFAGTWHEIEAYPKEQQTGTCVNHEFTATAGNSLNLVSNQIVNQLPTTASGSVTLNTTDGSGRLWLSITTGGQVIEIPYWVLSTDYNNYALVYSCMDLDTDFRAVNAWKLSRTNAGLTDAASTAINAAMANVQVLDNQYFETQNQTDAGCFFNPELQPGEPVILPGQCDSTIPVQANFDPVAYMGLWHDIQSYPSTFQTGTCNNAFYTLVDGTVDVYNTQVINQQLDTMNGVGIIPDASEPAKLLVSFPIAGTNLTTSTEYWVLGTDYANYSLVYSCSNLANDLQAVFSWKLSRTKALTAAATAAIDAITANIPVLDSRYYVPQDQSEAGCFYFPEARPGVPVVFPGQCSDAISAVPNFNFAQFAGTWHEIEAYPKEQQTGTCVNHEFTATAGNSLNLVSNQIVNQLPTTASGSVTLNTTDGSGRLWLSITTGGQVIEIPYWVLSTDYNNYALVYSCMDLDTDFRAVNAWKLSRTNAGLTDAASTAINAAMANVQVLDNQYFETQNQTDAGCFFNPELQPGEPVILPGQCDSTIPVQANFDPVAYMGLWHDIESYPSTFQTGTCNNAFYTLVDGTVDVYNTQVINQQLDTMNGVGIIPDASEPAKLLVSFPIAGTNLTTSTEYWVLGTDYANYSLVYSCSNLANNLQAVFSWKLSRTKTLTAAANAAIDAITANIPVLDSRYYVLQDQSEAGCFYFPEARPGVPVIFPGQCSDAISAIPNFNFAQFAGTWHEIEAYPKEQQTGTCVNHEFTSTAGNSLNLVSNQIVNQLPTTASGSVTLNTTDGSGRLWLSITTGGQVIEFPYWVLSTDYNNYALVYSCMDLDTDFRAVYAWKLSRTNGGLTAAASTAIDAAIANVQVLDNQYFETQNQTDAGCFFYPELQPGTPVIFPGQCDSTIPVQANFDPVAYMGLWHDIQSYPSTFQTGTCNNAFYTLVDGTVDVYNTQVISQQLDTMNGVGIIPDASEPAKLLVSFPIAGTNLTTSTEYWVLGTDYANYSLVYSCSNLANNLQAVFSWKLSRTKALTAAANAAIDAITANIPVLDSRYYVPQDQSEAGCFYFPEPRPGVPVVFPGQCDNTLAAVPNFNLAEFAGIWHEVEAYPKDQQSGSCINHEFTSTAGNSLNLVSNQVVEQLATSANGSVALNSTDLSGRLWLTLSTEAQIVEFPYWILATDYSSYALAYSCVDLNDDYRAVYSWKLSRTQFLTAAATELINTAIATVQVLDEQYFENIDQSVGGCFSYPNIPPGEPIVLEGPCLGVTPVANFDSAAFVGAWYETARYASERQSGECAAQQFTSTGQYTFALTQTIVYNERLTVVSGNADLAIDNSGRLNVTLSDGAGLSYTTMLFILDTDYANFALLYSCENIEGTNNRQIYSWKLSRSQAGLSQAANDRISEVIAFNIDLFEFYYQPTGQTSLDCFYYPVFEETPEVVVLPGSCPTISGIPNFSPADYLGNWYDVASYPIPSQNGTCSRAEYTLVDGVITIRNTMVVDRELRVQPGIARLSVTGTGLLQVTFILENGEETVAQYFILDTDYTSYSLVYNCRNLVDGSRQVFSWKLSRTPTLTAVANTAIDAIINSTQGLLEEYYQTQSQTDEDCFYVPEPVPGESVLFRGACPQVSGMQGFNAAQYVGWWHEIERYPTDEYPGQCTSANFIQSSTTAINVVETGVYDGVANETTSTAVLNANGSITINRDGEVSVWVVIGTDYNTYSLLYSCEDVQTAWGAYRRVWSAKHSKARALTAAAQTAMNPLIESNEVLHQQLYESVDQSDSACFHYREISDQVILPGQCDTNIPVQANFDLARFANGDSWYQIERYPYPQVSNDGTCVGSRYTVNGDSVSVLNWEVLDGTLNTIEGTATVNGARLSVTLPVQDSEETVTTDLHILATDYEDYALAYTCVNINSFERTVGAFKLSRNRGLSNAAQSAINNYMASRDELHQPYFLSISHDDDCEEPSSALLVKSSIIVMLVCVLVQLVL